MKIGFIDYYLDEWHANNYPTFFKERSGGTYEVCCAYGKIDSPNGGMTNKEWSQKHNIPLADTVEEVIEKSDAIIVLSPDNPEMHLELSDIALKSGKPVYVDKTFAPDKETAVKIFKNADKHNTKCFSSSALRFSSELDEIDINNIDRIYSEGPGPFGIYKIHQLEPIVRLMNAPAKRVMYTGDEKHPAMIIEFADGRTAQMYHRDDENGSFKLTTVNAKNEAKHYEIKSDYFALFIDAVIKFFETNESPVPHEQTVDVMALIEASDKAAKSPFEWIMV